MFRRTLSAAAALALTAGTVALATPVQAADVEDSVSIEVSTADLADSVRLERKVRMAAGAICGNLPVPGIERLNEIRACRDSVVANARAAVQTALASRSGPFRLALRSE